MMNRREELNVEMMEQVNGGSWLEDVALNSMEISEEYWDGLSDDTPFIIKVYNLF